MYKKYILLLFLITIFYSSYSQVGIGTNVPNTSAKLDVTSSDSGILIPRLSISDVSLKAPIAQIPLESLLVYNTNPATIGGKGVGFYFWDSLKWVYLINTNTISSYITPHNTLDMAYDEGGAGFGRTIFADSGYLNIGGGDGIRVTGLVNSGGSLGNTTGSQMFFYPRLAAFRTGSGSYNDILGAGNIGLYSVAMGFNNSATGQSSLALVNNATAVAESCVAIGNGARAVQQDDMALGQSAIANGTSATAIGESSEATGVSSIAIGSAAHSIGDQSTAVGKSCQAEATSSSAFGFGSQAISNESLAIGMGVRTDSFREFSLGSNNTNGGGNKTAWIVTDRLLSIGNGNPAGAASNAMVILKNGDTGIGKDVPTEKLDVNGNVKATNFISATTTYPDYVFEKYYQGTSKINKNYEMLSIDDAEKYVKSNGHLKGVKSYKEIKNNDLNINLAEVSIKNLEKIEELFLYIVELNNENKKLRKELNNLLKTITN
jgi:hypothetical protein